MPQQRMDIRMIKDILRLKYSAALSHRHGVKFYPSLDESRVRDDAARKLRSSTSSYRGRALSAWQAGADGVTIAFLEAVGEVAGHVVPQQWRTWGQCGRGIHHGALDFPARVVGVVDDTVALKHFHDPLPTVAAMAQINPVHRQVLHRFFHLAHLY